MTPDNFDWKGDKVVAQVQAANRYGINRTMGEGVALAKHLHPFTNRSSTAERSIRIAMAAMTEGKVTTGFWGSLGVKYFWFLEKGTSVTRGRTSIGARLAIWRRSQTARRSPKIKTRQLPPWKGGSWAPTLEPVAAKVYPRLAMWIGVGWRMRKA